MAQYPVQVRIDRPPESSRLWAVLTILWIKLIALIPHLVCLLVLEIAFWIVFIVAQVAVLFTGRFPNGIHGFMTGVMRWQTRVSGFMFNLSDRYPPFALRSVPEYEVDLDIEYPEKSNRLLAGVTVAVMVLVVVLAALLAGDGDSRSNNGVWLNQVGNFRWILAIPHVVVLSFIGIAAMFVWFIVQWVILFAASFPPGLHRFVGGYVRWSTRVNAFVYGLTDKYPPFSLEPDAGASAAVPVAVPAAEPGPPEAGA